MNMTFKEYKIPVSCSGQLNSFFGMIRLCFVPLRYGMSWISFVGEPVTDLKLQPIINDVDYLNKFPKAGLILEDFLGNIFKKLIFPNRIDLDVPLTIEI